MDNARHQPTMVRTDHGEANRRILAKEARADFRRVEAAAIMRRTSLHSAEGKRLFVRYFYTLQSRVYYISTIGRTRKPHDEIEAMESRIKEAISQASNLIDKYMDAVEQRLKDANVDTIASFTTVPMEEDVAIVSAIGRRYFELLHKLDQLMPLLQTLEIEELVTETELDRMRAKAKRITGRPASMARLLADRLRVEMRDPSPVIQRTAGNDDKDQAAAPGAESAIGRNGPALSQNEDVGAPPRTSDPEQPEQPASSESGRLVHAADSPLTVKDANATAQPVATAATPCAAAPPAGEWLGAG